MRRPRRATGGCRWRGSLRLLCFAPLVAGVDAQPGDDAVGWLPSAAEDFGDQGYVLRKFGADGCPGGFELGSREECEHAARKLGFKGVEAVTSSEMPTGCVSAPTQNSQHDRKGYFNSATSGSVHSSIAPICKTGMAAALGWDRCCSGHKSCGTFAGFCCPTNDQVMLGCCSGETSRYDGVYTSESSPGGDYFVIHGETVQWDAASQSKFVSEGAPDTGPAGGGSEGTVDFDCKAGLQKWEAGWSEPKKRWCCENEGKGWQGCKADNASVGHFSTWFENEGVARQATVVGDKIWWDAPFFQDVWLKVPKPKDDACISEATFTETTTVERTSTSASTTSTITVATPTSTTATPTTATSTSNTTVSSLPSTTATAAVAAEAEEAEFDCDAGLPNWEKGWSDAKKKWCCENESKGWHGCKQPAKRESDPATVLLEPPPERPHPTFSPTPSPTPAEDGEFDCEAGLPKWEKGWSETKKRWCCENEGKGWQGCKTASPTASPTAIPTASPTDSPTPAPTSRPTTLAPTDSPTPAPTTSPTAQPTEVPTAAPTAAPAPKVEMCPSARDDYRKDTTFDPVDMDSALVARQLPNISACQALCAATPHCFHFSFYSPNLDWPGQCHLQDIFALRQKSRFGFWAGPKKSWCQYKKSYREKAVQLVGPKGLAFDGMGEKTFVPEEFRCMVMGGSYEPAFVSRFMPKRATGKRYGGAVLDCQEWCRNTTGCVYFSIQYPARTCSLAAATAKLQFPISKTVSGPLSCKGEPRVKPNCTCPDDEEAAANTTKAVVVNTTGNASVENASMNVVVAMIADGSAPPEPSDSVVNNAELQGAPVLERVGENTKSLPTVATCALVFGVVLAGVNAARFFVGAYGDQAPPLGSRIMPVDEGYTLSRPSRQNADGNHEGYLYTALRTAEPGP